MYFFFCSLPPQDKNVYITHTQFIGNTNEPFISQHLQEYNTAPSDAKSCRYGKRLGCLYIKRNRTRKPATDLQPKKCHIFSQELIVKQYCI
jgi:hypothetical protein